MLYIIVPILLTQTVFLALIWKGTALMSKEKDTLDQVLTFAKGPLTDFIKKLLANQKDPVDAEEQAAREAEATDILNALQALVPTPVVATGGTGSSTSTGDTGTGTGANTGDTGTGSSLQTPVVTALLWGQNGTPEAGMVSDDQGVTWRHATDEETAAHDAATNAPAV